MKTPRPRSIRRALRQIHLWLGLAAGLVLAVAGISGSALVFAEKLVRYEAPELFHDPGPGDWQPVSRWIKDAELRYPDLAPLTYVFGAGAIPMPTGTPLLFKQTTRNGAERHTLVPIDPVKGIALARIDAEDTWAGLLVIFHKELFAHHTGALILAICGVACLISLFSGLFLWWPGKKVGFRALGIRGGLSGKGFLRDIHAVPAVWLYLPLLASVTTGVYLQKPQWVDPIVNFASPIRSVDLSQIKASISTCHGDVTIDEALSLAREGRPLQVLRHLFVPQGEQPAYQIELRSADANPRATGTAIYVDRNCPRMLAETRVADMTAGEQLKAWAWPLHTDLMLGVVGQALVFLSGVLLAGLFVTGMMYWLKGP